MDRKQERNYGIDALRLAAMFMVVVLHILGKGSVLQTAQGIQSKVSWFLQIAAFCAVDCYALISGYTGYTEHEKKYRYGKYFGMWLQAFFYSFGCTLLWYFARPGSVSRADLAMSAFPVLTDQYWYFRAYTPLFFVIPWLNRLVRRSTEREVTGLVAVLFALLSCYGTAAALFADPFVLKEGYSFVWLAFLYLAGAWMKKCRIAERVSIRTAVLVYLLSVLVTWGSRMAVHRLTVHMLGYTFGRNLLYNYTSPTVVAAAGALLIWFSRLRVEGICRKAVRFLAPASFGVYLLHRQDLVFDRFFNGTFRFLAVLSPWKIPFAVLGIAFAVCAVCLLIDKARARLFALCRVAQAGERIDHGIRGVWDRIAGYLVKN